MIGLMSVFDMLRVVSLVGRWVSEKMRLRMRRAVVTVLGGCTLVATLFLSGGMWSSSCSDISRLDNNFNRWAGNKGRFVQSVASYCVRISLKDHDNYEILLAKPFEYLLL